MLPSFIKQQSHQQWVTLIRFLLRVFP
jgi:hypothetical protein